MARCRYQTGCLFVRGRKGRKVWVARWREDVMKPDGTLERVMRSEVLGSASELQKREARKKLEDRLRPINQGLYRPLSVMRFRDYAEGDWSTLVLPTFKLSTRRGYRMVLGRHLLPRFGDVQLCDIAKLGVQQFVGEKFRQGLAWQTVRNAWIVLSSILDSAVEYGYLVVNPARGIKFPPQSLRQNPEIFTAEAFARLLAHLEEPFKTMVTLAALTGLRIGEVLGLRWRALDFVAGTIRVSESVFLGQFQKPKSEKSHRTIPIGPLLGRLLENHRQWSIAPSPDKLVFQNRRGGPHRESNLLERVLRPAGRRQELDG
jgi:integrase